MVRISIAAAALIALTGGLASAQITPIDKGVPAGGDIPSINEWSPYYRTRTPEQVGRDVEIEQNYRAAVSKIPDRKPSNDPWKSIRPSAATTVDRHRPQ